LQISIKEISDVGELDVLKQAFEIDLLNENCGYQRKFISIAEEKVNVKNDKI